MKKLLSYSLILGLLLGGSYGGCHAYVSLRQARLIRQARAFLDRSEGKKALLCLQRVLRHNPNDLEACQLMADLTEAGRSPSTLLWRSRVVELNPGSLDDRLALARTAMMMRDYAAATNALEGVAPAGRMTPAFHNIAGSVAAALNQPAEAEAHFLEAARLEPQNPIPQLNLAVVRLHGTNGPARADARIALQELSSNPTNSSLRSQALRELTLDALRAKEADSALACSARLLQETNSAFRDRLLRLEVLRASRNAGFKPTLTALQSEAGVDPAKIYELSMWQMANTPPADLLSWLQSLPPNIQTNQPVAVLSAECYVLLQDWRGLHDWIKPQNWGELEFMRHAFQTRALRGQNLAAAAKAEWELASKAASGQKTQLVMLLGLAVQWRWQSDAEELLWSIVNQYPGEEWAFRALAQALYSTGRTRPLMMLYSQQLKRSPSDLGARNNLAMTALLLDAQELKPHDLARDVFEKVPTNAAFVSTYAFSLHVQKKDAAALKIMEQLKPQELEHPAIAGYYGVILKATGSDARAKTYLDLAFKTSLLPEERKVFEKAKAEL